MALNVRHYPTGAAPTHNKKNREKYNRGQSSFFLTHSPLTLTARSNNQSYNI